MVATRDNPAPRSNLGDPAYWPEHLKHESKPRDRGPHNWKARDWNPELQVPFNPDQSQHAEILKDVSGYYLSVATVAARYDTTRDAFLDWLAQPHIRAKLPQPAWHLPETVETLLDDFQAFDPMVAAYRAGKTVAQIADDWGIPAEHLAAVFAHPRAQQRLQTLQELDDQQDLELFKHCRRVSAKKLLEVVETSTDPIESRKAATVLFRFSNNALNPPTPRSPRSDGEPRRGGEGSGPPLPQSTTGPAPSVPHSVTSSLRHSVTSPPGVPPASPPAKQSRGTAVPPASTPAPSTAIALASRIDLSDAPLSRAPRERVARPGAPGKGASADGNKCGDSGNTASSDPGSLSRGAAPASSPGREPRVEQPICPSPGGAAPEPATAHVIAFASDPVATQSSGTGGPPVSTPAPSIPTDHPSMSPATDPHSLPVGEMSAAADEAERATPSTTSTPAPSTSAAPAPSDSLSHSAAFCSSTPDLSALAPTRQFSRAAAASTSPGCQPQVQHALSPSPSATTPSTVRATGPPLRSAG